MCFFNLECPIIDGWSDPIEEAYNDPRTWARYREKAPGKKWKRWIFPYVFSENIRKEKWLRERKEGRGREAPWKLAVVAHPGQMLLNFYMFMWTALWTCFSHVALQELMVKLLFCWCVSDFVLYIKYAQSGHESLAWRTARTWWLHLCSHSWPAESRWHRKVWGCTWLDNHRQRSWSGVHQGELCIAVSVSIITIIIVQ